MKLVEILARELEEWPKGVHVFGCDKDGEVRAYKKDGSEDLSKYDFYPNQRVRESDRCDSYGMRGSPTLVTRADWQAEKEKLEGKAVKKPSANKDGWVRHRGGKCPVEAGTLVDVRHRDGEIIIGVKALSLEIGAMKANWLRDTPHKAAGEIMAYRIHTPSEQPATAEESSPVDPVASISGPLQWRDRITEIDAESKAENERHSAAMTALNAERAELVQKLASEGLALIERKAEPVEDMSDWRNWKAGDVITCNTDEWSRVYTKGLQYKVKASNPLVVFDDCGPGSACTIKDRDAKKFTFHSRPTN